MGSHLTTTTMHRIPPEVERYETEIRAQYREENLKNEEASSVSLVGLRYVHLYVKINLHVV